MLSRTARWISSLTFILILSVILRVGVAVYLGNEVVPLPGTADQVSYHTLATRVLAGHGFSFNEAWWPVTGAGEPTAHWSYLYTFYLVFVYSIFGTSPLAARLIQAVIVGLLQPYLAYRIAGKAFDTLPGIPEKIARRIPILAASITAVYFYFFYYAGTLMTEAFFITAVMAVFLLSFRLREEIHSKGYWKSALGLGLAISAAVLLRQLFLLFIPFLFVWLWVSALQRKVVKRAFYSTLIASLVLLAAILPFTIYNYARFNRFVLLNTNAGYVLFWANHPIHGTNFIPASEMGDTYQKLVPVELRKLDEAALDQALLEEGINFIAEDPGRYILLSLSRIPAYFKFWPDADSGTISNISRVGSFGLFLPFIMYGLARYIFYLRRGEGSNLLSFAISPIALLFSFILIYSLMHVMTWTLVRYRLPVDAILVLFSALAMAGLGADVSNLFGRQGLSENKEAAEQLVATE